MIDGTRMALAITASWTLISTTSLASGADTGSETRWLACTKIADPWQRLQCYDDLAGRDESPLIAQPGETSQAQKGSIPSVAPRDTFGLTEKIVPPTPQTVEAVVTALHRSANNQIIVILSNGQAWQMLDSGDSRLDIGAHIVIRRAALGSFLMTLEGGRTHRVHRLS
jgi:hypothetical protein